MIYLASPYSHPDDRVRKQRFDQICGVAGLLMSKGHHVFSPIAHAHPIAQQVDLPTGWDFWERQDREMLAACSDLWVCQMPQWEGSTGVQAEIKIAKELGLPVRYVDPGTLEVKEAP